MGRKNSTISGGRTPESSQHLPPVYGLQSLSRATFSACAVAVMGFYQTSRGCLSVKQEENPILHIMCVCSLNYPACKAQAPCHIVICGLSDSTMFPHYVTNGTIFGKHLMNIKCVIFLNSFFFLKLARYHQNTYRSSCKVPVILVGF